MAARRGDTAIEALREFQGHKRQAGGDIFKIWTVELSGVIFHDAIYDLDSSISELAITASRNHRIGIARGADDFAYAGRNKGIGTRRRFTEMGTRLKRDDQRGPASMFAG